MPSDDDGEKTQRNRVEPPQRRGERPDPRWVREIKDGLEFIYEALSDIVRQVESNTRVQRGLRSDIDTLLDAKRDKEPGAPAKVVVSEEKLAAGGLPVVAVEKKAAPKKSVEPPEKSEDVTDEIPIVEGITGTVTRKWQRRITRAALVLALAAFFGLAALGQWFVRKALEHDAPAREAEHHLPEK